MWRIKCSEAGLPEGTHKVEIPRENESAVTSYHRSDYLMPLAARCFLSLQLLDVPFYTDRDCEIRASGCASGWTQPEVWCERQATLSRVYQLAWSAEAKVATGQSQIATAAAAPTGATSFIASPVPFQKLRVRFLPWAGSDATSSSSSSAPSNSAVLASSSSVSLISSHEGFFKIWNLCFQ
jgi:hypothetical protein